MPLQSTSGAASYDAFGGGTAAKVNYIEDFFQSYLRTGTGASATVTTGLDGSTKETLVWTKSRSAATNHKLTDNVRGATKALSSNTTGAEATDSQGLTAFSATGYTIGTNTDYNNSGATYVDWQWVSQPKFFDIVTWTGNDVTTGRQISHSLASTVGCIIAKRTDGPDDWYVWHRGLSSGYWISLNQTSAQSNFNARLLFGNGTVAVDPTSSVFTVGIGLNSSPQTFVAYLFAHNAGGFGLTGTDNVISCGSYAGTASGTAAYVDLGWEPQFVITKKVNAVSDWITHDTMRGLSYTGYQDLAPNLSRAEETKAYTTVRPSPTGFFVDWGNNGSNGGAGTTYIYIAIRRGPMKVPTDATKVYYGLARAGTGTATSLTTVGFAPDLVLSQFRNSGGFTAAVRDKLRGRTKSLYSGLTDTEATYTDDITGFLNNGISIGSTGSGSDNVNGAANTYINWFMGRAPSFFDEVCYTGNNSTQNISHNLGVAPEFVIIKSRSNANSWRTFNSFTATKFTRGELNVADALVPNQSYAGGDGFNSQPTSTTLPLDYSPSNYTGQTYVAYLFATCAGVSKVGSYTGTGATQTISCGFTGGARFVLIKRTDSTGDWYVWDSARGIVAGNDPYLRLNSSVAEVTNTDYVDTYSAGFEISSTAPSAINASGGTFIFLAIA